MVCDAGILISAPYSDRTIPLAPDMTESSRGLVFLINKLMFKYRYDSILAFESLDKRVDVLVVDRGDFDILELFCSTGGSKKKCNVKFPSLLKAFDDSRPKVAYCTGNCHSFNSVYGYLWL